MHETATPEKTQAEIPFGILEYTAVFKRPILEAWTVPALLVSAALNVLEPFGFKLDGVEVKTPPNLSEYALVFRRTPPGVALTLGIVLWLLGITAHQDVTYGTDRTRSFV
jgi:hypothetical protein